eukprot:TRINITY_DN6933_c1_g2_i1.p2 TRINITY_DN6933_c1_g2~~TRINITY_DN6933_c1_g2_i1.p2  ORF type:complete len:144 (-),score=10.99 TRINITY_DN6933_c1_g2_i1:43-474(-)
MNLVQYTDLAREHYSQVFKILNYYIWSCLQFSRKELGVSLFLIILRVLMSWDWESQYQQQDYFFLQVDFGSKLRQTCAGIYFHSSIQMQELKIFESFLDFFVHGNNQGVIVQNNNNNNNSVVAESKKKNQQIKQKQRWEEPPA